MLTKGVREDLRARLASEKAAAEDQAELNGKGESEAVVEVLEAAEGLAEASNHAKFSGVDGTKRKRPNGVQPRRQQGPKVGYILRSVKGDRGWFRIFDCAVCSTQSCIVGIAALIRCCYYFGSTMAITHGTEFCAACHLLHSSSRP